MTIVPEKLHLVRGVEEINNCYYYKTDSGIVTVTAAVKKSVPFKNAEVIACLPEGYRPRRWVELPATFGNRSGERFAGTSLLSGDGELCIIFDPSVQPVWAYIQFTFLV